MNIFLSRAFNRFCVGAIILSISRIVVAQSPADVPAAVVAGTCKGVEYNRGLLSSPVSVDILVEVDDSGKAVSMVPLVAAPDPTLQAAIVAAVMACKFLPARKDGKPTTGLVRVVYPFGPAVSAKSLGRGPEIADVRGCAPTADDYPAASRQLNETGTTRVSFTVNPEGHLTAFGVVRSSGFLRLDLTALIKLAGCKFKTATSSDGNPISASVEVEYVWKLE